MHELSIALCVVEMAEERAREAGAIRIDAVRLRIGELAGVASGALRFAFDIARRGTPLRAARLIIEEVPASVWCPGCRAERTLSVARLRCPACGAPAELRGGRELELTELEVDDGAAAHR